MIAPGRYHIVARADGTLLAQVEIREGSDMGWHFWWRPAGASEWVESDDALGALLGEEGEVVRA